ncbi:hypothetical protein TNCV_4512481 [Trichonephila clavipes]|nr:hypothetical protein TNCV_4512481 [Trichonephila clavipes]
MRDKNYCAHHNTRDHWTLRCMKRCPDLVVCLKRELQYLRPEASLVLIYRPYVAGMKGRVDLAQPVNRTPDLWSREHAGHSIRCIVSASIMFSTRRALCGRELSSWKTKESPMAPASLRSPMLNPPHTIQRALLYCDLSRTNAGLFRVPLSLHTRTRRVSHSRLNRDSSVNSTWLQSRCSQSRCSAAHLLQTARWRGVNGMQTIGLRA